MWTQSDKSKPIRKLRNGRRHKSSSSYGFIRRWMQYVLKSVTANRSLRYVHQRTVQAMVTAILASYYCLMHANNLDKMRSYKWWFLLWSEVYILDPFGIVFQVMYMNALTALSPDRTISLCPINDSGSPSMSLLLLLKLHACGTLKRWCLMTCISVPLCLESI